MRRLLPFTFVFLCMSSCVCADVTCYTAPPSCCADVIVEDQYWSCFTTTRSTIALQNHLCLDCDNNNTYSPTIVETRDLDCVKYCAGKSGQGRTVEKLYDCGSYIVSYHDSTSAAVSPCP